MTFIHIKKRKVQRPDGPVEIFSVPAMSITSAQGKRLIPNPAGSEACVFDTLEAAEEAVRRAGFDYVYEGRTTYTLQRSAGENSPVAGALTLQESIPILTDRLKDREPAVIANAAFALGELVAATSAQGLGQILGHDDATVRKNAAEALAKLGEPGLKVLKEAFVFGMKSSEKHASYVRLSVMVAYLELTRVHRELLSEILPQVVEALQDDNWLVRSQAALVIAHSAPYFRPDEPGK